MRREHGGLAGQPYLLNLCLLQSLLLGTTILEPDFHLHEHITTIVNYHERTIHVSVSAPVLNYLQL